MESNRRTELYKDFDIYVLVIPRAERKSNKSGQGPTRQGFVVRVCESDVDPTAVETLVTHSCDEYLLPTREAAEDAGLMCGYGLIDQLLKRNAVQQSINL